MCSDVEKSEPKPAFGVKACPQLLGKADTSEAQNLFINLILIQHLLCASHSKCYINLKLFNSHNNPIIRQVLLLSSFLPEEGK